MAITLFGNLKKLYDQELYKSAIQLVGEVLHLLFSILS